MLDVGIIEESQYQIAIILASVNPVRNYEI